MSVAAVAATVVIASAVPARAQSTPPREQRDSRYQIGMMEGVLEKAVEHGAAVIRERMLKVFPADMLLSQPVRVRGVRLDGYGVVFDIDVPSLQSAQLWSLQTLDQNNLGLESAISALRDHVNALGDPKLQQALQRMELAVPMTTLVSGGPGAASGAAAGATTPATAVRRTSGSALATDDDAPSSTQPQAVDPVLSNPSEAYHTEIQEALIDAMLDHSRGLAIGANEWLTVVAGGVDTPPLAGLDSDGYTAVISIKGSDLADFLGNRISHDEARQRIQVKLF